MITFETRIHTVPGPMQVVEIPADVAEAWLPVNGKRCLYKLFDGELYHGGFIHNGLGGYQLIIGKKARDAAGVSAGSAVTITLSPDTSRYGCDMPDELAEVLATDSKANDVFHALTPGRQRSLIYLVTAVKSTDKRIGRSLKIAEALHLGLTDPRKILPSNP